MNIYLQELRMLRGSFVVWMLSLLALAALYLSVYPAFSHDTQTLTEMFAHMSDAYRNIFSAGGFEIFTFLGFLANILSLLLLAGGIQAMNMGITLANRERLAQTTDFLLAKPVARWHIFGYKLLAHLTVLATTSLILITTVYVGAHAMGAGGFSMQTFLMIMGVFTGLQLWFFAVGLAVSAIAGRIRAIVGVSTATVFGSFVLGLLGSVIGDEAIRYVTPFKYVDLVEVLMHQTYDTAYIIVWAAVIVVSIGFSWTAYQRRDIRT